MLPNNGKSKKQKLKLKKCKYCNKTFAINQEDIISTGKRKTIICNFCEKEQVL